MIDKGGVWPVEKDTAIEQNFIRNSTPCLNGTPIKKKCFFFSRFLETSLIDFHEIFRSEIVQQSNEARWGSKNKF